MVRQNKSSEKEKIMTKVIVKKEIGTEEQQTTCQFDINNETDFDKLIVHLRYFLDVASCDDKIVDIRLRRRLQ